jgi:hypothetical protein
MRPESTGSFFDTLLTERACRPKRLTAMNHCSPCSIFEHLERKIKVNAAPLFRHFQHSAAVLQQAKGFI